jgi:hypothetical protein
VKFSFATEPAPGRTNEDHVVVAAGFAIVLDGVTQLPGLDSGCVHGPGWYVRTLGANLATALSDDPAVPLDAALTGAIRDVCAGHAGTCDLTNPNSPSSTVAVVRERDEHLDYLVLCDSAVVFEGDDGLVVVDDDRTERLPSYDRASVAALRNRPGGFWVASTMPEAAAEALTGTVEADRVRRLLLCTDGVSRLVQYFDRTWPEVFALAEAAGPGAVIDAVRAAEIEHPDRITHPVRNVKKHDDATLVLRSR